MNYLQRKKAVMMRNASNWRGYLRNAEGYPAVLYKTMAGKPKTLTVYGAEGGVGDKTANLFDKNSIVSTFAAREEIPIAGGYRLASIALRANTNYYIKAMGTPLSIYGGVNVEIKSYSGSYVNLSSKRPALTKGSLTTNESGMLYIFFAISGSASQNAAAVKSMLNSLDLMIIEGHSEPLSYEPYGYKIPIICNAPLLPSGYTKLEYIESTGTQYIDTGTVLTQDNSYELSLAISSTTSGAVGVFGARESASRNSISANYFTANGLVADFNNSDYSTYRCTYMPTLNEKYIIYGDKNSRTISDGNGNILAENNAVCSDVITTPSNATIFKLNGTTWELVSMKSYYCKIWNSGTLIRNFIPAKRNSDGVVGMYDAVNGVFYANADTSGDNFIAGAEIPTKTVKLYTPQQLVSRASRNLFDFSAFLASMPPQYPIYNGTYTATSDSITLTATADDCFTRTWDPVTTTTYRVSVTPNTRYKLTWEVSGDLGRIGIFNNGSYATGYGTYPWNSSKTCTFTTTSDASYITIRFGVASKGGTATYSKIQLNTEAAYEPYGATIYDTLTVTDNAAVLSLKAAGGSDVSDTDITAIQDFTQDMAIPKADEVSVSAGTAVEPGKIEVDYYSREKEA